MLYEGGDLEQARLQMNAVANNPDATDGQLAEALHTRALCAMHRDRLTEARVDLALALHLAPDQGLLWNTLGAWHILKRDAEPAREALEKARRLLPQHPDPILNLGILHEAGGRPEQAARYYREALAADPGCAEARRRLERTADLEPAGV
jgi:Flp pilus assembly protein TadD